MPANTTTATTTKNIRFIRYLLKCVIDPSQLYVCIPPDCSEHRPSIGASSFDAQVNARDVRPEEECHTLCHDLAHHRRFRASSRPFPLRRSIRWLSSA